MRAEELYESLAGSDPGPQDTGELRGAGERQKHSGLQQFVTAFGNDDGGEATTFNGTIPQALMMFNGDLVKKATSTARG